MCYNPTKRIKTVRKEYGMELFDRLHAEIDDSTALDDSRLQEVIEKNRSSANFMIAVVEFLFFIGVLVIWMLSKTRVYFDANDDFNFILSLCGVIYFTSSVWCISQKKSGVREQWILLISFMTANTVMSIYCVYRYCYFLLTLPILFSSRYYSMRTVLYESALGIILGGGLFLIFGPYYGLEAGVYDIGATAFPENFVLKVRSGLVHSLYEQGFLTNKMVVTQTIQTAAVLFCLILVTTVAAVMIARSGKKILIRTVELLDEKHAADMNEEELRTRVMLSQIQPHFLFNSLSTISALCTADPEKAKSAANDFADYMRGNLDSLRESRIVSFEEELEHTAIYLRLEKLRFGEDMNVVYHTDFTDFDLPSLSVQPIAENAVKYGICGNENGGTVVISSEREGGNAVITVEDDGPGFDTNMIKNDGRSHVGIESVRSRLENMCGGSLIVESEPGAGTKAKIIIPLKTNDDDEETEDDQRNML